MDGMNISEYVDLDSEMKLRELKEEEAQKLPEMEAADVGGRMTIAISTKRRRRPCKGYARGREL